MSTQIIAAVVTAAAACITIVVTLGLALLNGFRSIRNIINQTAKELRDDIKELRKDNAAQIRELREDNAAQIKELREDNRELREDNKELRRDIAKNAEGIARIEGGMTVLGTVMESILQHVLPNPVHQVTSTADPPVGTAAPQTEAAREPRSAPIAVGAAAAGRR